MAVLSRSTDASEARMITTHSVANGVRDREARGADTARRCGARPVPVAATGRAAGRGALRAAGRTARSGARAFAPATRGRACAGAPDLPGRTGRLGRALMRP